MLLDSSDPAPEHHRDRTGRGAQCRPEPVARTPAAAHPPAPRTNVAAKPRPARHIAIFTYALTWGGAQRRTVTLANSFAERGHRVDLVVIRSQGALNHELSSAVRLVGLDRHPITGLAARVTRQRGAQTFSSIPALARYLRRERPDVLLSSASHVNLVALLGWRLARRPMPIVLRASNYPAGNLKLWPPMQRAIRRYLRWLAARLYPWADAVIAVSDGVADEVSRLTGMQRSRVTTIYNPVVTSELIRKSKAVVDHPWFAPGSPPVILSAGRLTIQKDFPTLLRAFARVRTALPARLMILGEGTQRKKLEAMAARLGIESDVLLPGFVDNTVAWMAKASVFVLSSAWEGLPGVVIEALAAGCPVVSTDCPCGPSEILENGSYGLLVPCHDHKALADAILTALAAQPDRKRLRSRAMEFSSDGPPHHYLKILEGCILRWHDEHAKDSRDI